MGGQATARKRRRGLRMTRRTLPKNKLLKIANAVKDATCKDKWDKFKTPAENLKSMGLDPNPNAVIRTEPIDPQNVGFMGFMDLTAQDEVKTDLYAVSNPKRKKMSEYDQTYILTLTNTYGTDYKKMFRDLKLNYKQCSEHQLEKMVEKYNSLPEAQKMKLE